MATFIKPYTENEDRSKKYAQEYDKEKITLTQAGRTFNLYDYIQEQREDTEIYPTLEKYGNLEIMERPANEIASEFEGSLELRDLYDQEIKLKELFESLPLEERREFDMNYYKFKEYGLEFYTDKANKEIKLAEEQRAAQIEESKKPIKVEVTNTVKE